MYHPDVRPWQYERPHFGSFGQIDTVGDRLVCHICGRDFAALSKHVSQIHDISADRYREMFGLNRTHGLWSASLKKRQSEKQTARGLGDIGRAVMAKRSPEELQAQRIRAGHKGEPRRREIQPHLAELGRRNARLGNAAAREAGVLDWRARQTHCKRGHEFTPENTYHWGKDGKWRACRACSRDQMRASRAAKQAHAAT
jgi:hypothetical protein